MKIIYPINPNDEMSPINILSPSTTCGLTVAQIAEKDVPHGTPYKIVSDATIPTDRTFRHAWEIQVSECTDGTGQNFGVGSNNPVPDGWLPELREKDQEYAVHNTEANWQEYLATEQERLNRNAEAQND